MRFVIAALVLLSCAHPHPQYATAEIGDEYARAVRIEPVCVDPLTLEIETPGIGSGVIISDRQVLTAGHVVDCPLLLGAYAIDADGTKHEMFLEATAEGADIVRLKLFPQDPKGFGFKDLSASHPVVGDEVCILSAVPARRRVCGQVTGYEDLDSGNLMHTALTEYGNSGGGLWDAEHRLVGIVTHLIPCNTGGTCGGRATSLADRKWLLE